MLGFIIPLRHHESVPDWSEVTKLLASTLVSVSAQTDGAWSGVIVANEGAELPDLPPGFDVVRVTFPLRTLPDRNADIEVFYNSFRDDKGGRVLAGLRHLRHCSHVMAVDHDDLVHRDLAAFVSQHPTANGWYLDSGFFFSGSRLLYRRPRDFFEHCGTSHIIRTDLLGLPPDGEPVPADFIRYRLGSHKFIRRALHEQGTPLAPLPFEGAIYRVGHRSSVSASAGVLAHIFGLSDLVRKPHRSLARLTRLRLLTANRQRAFFGNRSAV